MARYHSEKQRDNSGKTANYQRYSATIFFDAHLAYVLNLFSSAPLSRGAGGENSPRRRVRGEKVGLARAWGTHWNAGRRSGETVLSGASVFEEHVGGFLADHDRGRVGVAGRYGRHDGGIGDPQPADAVDPQARIADRLGVGPHMAGADRMQV